MKLLAIVLATSALVACSDPSPTTTTPGGDARSVAARPAPGPGTADRDAAIPAAPPRPAVSTPADEAPLDADYLGRWTGVEGMFLVVTPKPGGGVSLEMQWDLDHRGTFDGSVTAEGLRFMREGVAESAVRTDGDATGLKYLAGKKDCLTVKPGEGYCRD